MYVESKKNDTNELTKQKETENELMVARGEGIVREFGKIMCTLLYSKWITNKDLLYSTRNSMLCGAWMGGGFQGELIHIYVWLNPVAVHIKLPRLAIHQYKIKSLKNKGTSLVVPWLGLCISSAGGLWVQFPIRELRPHMLHSPPQKEFNK